MASTELKKHGRELARISGGGIIEGATWDGVKAAVGSALMAACLKAIGEHWPAVAFGAAAFAVSLFFILHALRRRNSIVNALREEITADIKAELAGRESTDEAAPMGVLTLRQTLASAEDRLDHLRDEVASLNKYAAGLEAEFTDRALKLDAKLESVPSNIRQSIDRLRDELKQSMATVQQEILFAANQDAVFLDEEAKDNIKKTQPLALTAIQMFEAIRSTDSLLRREFAKRYLGAYVTWKCWLYNRSVSKDGDIDVSMRLFPPPDVASLYANFNHSQILVSVKIPSDPIVANLKDGAPIMLIGRIWMIILYAGFGGMAFHLDDVEIRERQSDGGTDGPREGR